MKHNLLSNLSDEEMRELDKILLDEEGLIKIVPAKVLEGIPQEKLSVWCHYNAIYGLHTTELIEWIASYIKPDKTIEIGAGKGTLGRYLGIPQTDSYLSIKNEEVRLYYLLWHQQPIQPHKYVLEYDALEAVKHFKPEVVIGSWITQQADQQIPQSNYWGVKEEEILKLVGTYIVIGNESSHGLKDILKYEHKKFSFDWLYSRSLGKEKNTIYVWEMKEDILKIETDKLLETVDKVINENLNNSDVEQIIIEKNNVLNTMIKLNERSRSKYKLSRLRCDVMKLRCFKIIKHSIFKKELIQQVQLVRRIALEEIKRLDIKRKQHER